MSDSQLNKVFESVYSLSKQRTLKFKMESGIKTIPALSPTQLQAPQRSHARQNTYTDLFEPVESMQAVTQRKYKFSELYKSRLLPSLFLVTPRGLLKKLKQEVYGQKSQKHAKFRENDPAMTMESRSEVFKFQPGNTLESHLILQKSCKRILEENKVSRKKLKVASRIINKKSDLKDIFVRPYCDLEENGFKARLKKASEQLEKLDKSSEKHSNTKLPSIYKTLD